MSILINEAMKAERAKVLRADPYERTAERTGHGNGCKPKDVKSRLGNLSLQIPQVRGGVKFYPSAREKGERSERALKTCMAEMYVKGAPTRKVSSVLEKLGNPQGGLTMIYGLYPGIPPENIAALMDAMERYAGHYT